VFAARVLQHTPDWSASRKGKKVTASLAAYFAELRSVEDDYYSRFCQKSRVLGVSFWDANLDQLREIDQKYNIRPDDPRVYSIAAFLGECKEIDDEWNRLCRQNNWRGYNQKAPGFQAFWLAQGRYWARKDDCLSRHFPGLRTGHVDTLPKLWAYIKSPLLAAAKVVERVQPDKPGQRPLTYPESVAEAYRLMLELKISWTPQAPFPNFTQQEAIHELTRIANRLEKEEDERLVAAPKASVDPNPSLIIGANPIAGQRPVELTFHDLTRTIVFNDDTYEIDHADAFHFFKLVAEAKGKLVPTKVLRNSISFPKDVSDWLNAHIPSELRKLLHSRRGPGGGYSILLRLPSWEKG
jgi:hypothetical protein